MTMGMELLKIIGRHSGDVLPAVFSQYLFLLPVLHFSSAILVYLGHKVIFLSNPCLSRTLLIIVLSSILGNSLVELGCLGVYAKYMVSLNLEMWHTILPVLQL